MWRGEDQGAVVIAKLQQFSGAPEMSGGWSSHLDLFILLMVAALIKNNARVHWILIIEKLVHMALFMGWMDPSDSLRLRSMNLAVEWLHNFYLVW